MLVEHLRRLLTRADSAEEQPLVLHFCYFWSTTWIQPGLQHGTPAAILEHEVNLRMKSCEIYWDSSDTETIEAAHQHCLFSDFLDLFILGKKWIYSDSERSTLTDRAWAIVGWVQPDFFYMRKNKLQYCLNHSEFCQHLQLMNIGNNDFWSKRREGKSSGCLWEKFLCSQKEVPERNRWAHEGWLELHSGILWLEGSHLGTQQRWWGCWIWRQKEPGSLKKVLSLWINQLWSYHFSFLCKILCLINSEMHIWSHCDISEVSIHPTIRSALTRCQPGSGRALHWTRVLAAHVHILVTFLLSWLDSRNPMMFQSINHIRTLWVLTDI